MNVTIYPSRFILDKAFLGSKSLTHRFLIASWLINEGIIFENVPNNDDINATLNFLKAIGKEIIYTSSNSLYVKPSSLNNKLEQLYVDVNGSTSTLLFLLPVSLQLAKKVIFKCNDDLIKNPLSIYQELTNYCNLSIQKKGNEIICSGSINLDYYELDGKASSQFITGLIINALYLKKATTIKVNEPFICKEYVLMSIEIFKQFGFDITINNNIFYIHNNFTPNWDYLFIEGDYSIGANYMALAALNGCLNAYNFNEHSLQSDKKITDYLRNMGGNVKYINDNHQITLYIANNSLLDKGIRKQLKASNFDLCECIDLSCILMVLASFSNGISYFNNVNNLHDKELERVNIMFEILKKLNVNIIRKDNVISIKGQKDYYNNTTIDSYNDHRIVMAISVFALLNNGEITINNVDCVSKSDPNFFKNLIDGCKVGAINLKETN